MRAAYHLNDPRLLLVLQLIVKRALGHRNVQIVVHSFSLLWGLKERNGLQGHRAFKHGVIEYGEAAAGFLQSFLRALE